jgi:SAM-dependent methyltransferase
VVGTSDKYADKATRWTDEQYADARGYLEHRAHLVRTLGPALGAGDTVLDFACGDGGLAEFLLPHGLGYLGVDGSPAMVAAATERLAGRGRAAQGDLNTYVPPQPVAATTVFRALYYASDREAFFRHVGGFTERKLVFDLNPRQFSLRQVRAELAAAGFPQLALRPFLMPQNVALPGPARRLAVALERTPLARLALRYRFTYVIAASRSS